MTDQNPATLDAPFKAFATLLEERFAAGVHTTEDTVRYTFYAALTASGAVRHTEVTLEYRHPAIPGAEIDTLIQPQNGSAVCALEFKFDRANPSGTNQNRTQRAGAVIADMMRLAQVPDTLAPTRYFVYVTDGEMARYFKNQANRLHTLFDAPDATPTSIGAASFEGFSKTLVARIGNQVCPCTVTSVFAADLPTGHAIRVWAITPA